MNMYIQSLCAILWCSLHLVHVHAQKPEIHRDIFRTNQNDPLKPIDVEAFLVEKEIRSFQILLNNKQIGYIKGLSPYYSQTTSVERRTVLSYIPGTKLRAIKKLMRRRIKNTGFTMHEQEAVIDQFIVEFIQQAALEHAGLIDLNKAKDIINHLTVCTKKERSSYKKRYRSLSPEERAPITAIQKIACEF